VPVPVPVPVPVEVSKDVDVSAKSASSAANGFELRSVVSSAIPTRRAVSRTAAARTAASCVTPRRIVCLQDYGDGHNERGIFAKGAGPRISVALCPLCPAFCVALTVLCLQRRTDRERQTWPKVRWHPDNGAGPRILWLSVLSVFLSVSRSLFSACNVGATGRMPEEARTWDALEEVAQHRTNPGRAVYDRLVQPRHSLSF
jgi:hypothetical protein